MKALVATLQLAWTGFKETYMNLEKKERENDAIRYMQVLF